MKFLFAIAIIAGISLIGSRITFLRKQFGLGVKNIFLTGIEYIVFGLLLGSSGLDILDAEIIEKFQPFVVFGLAWIGYLYGIQFEIKLVRKLPKKFFSITVIQAVITFILVMTAMFVFLHFTSSLSFNEVLIVSIVLGITALSTAQSALAIVNKSFKFDNQRLFDLLRYISGVDGLIAILLFGILLCIVDPATYSIVSPLIMSKWILLTVFTSILPVAVFLLLTRDKYKHGEFLLLLTGIVAFSSGMSFQFGLSPLIIGFISGFALANTCKFRVRALNYFSEGEKPFYIIMLIILGAGWNFEVGISIVTILIFVLFRIIGKVVGNFVASNSFDSTFKISNGIGLALLSTGGISFGIIISFKILFPKLSDEIIYIILIAAFFFELISPKLILIFFEKRTYKNSKLKENISDEK